MIFNAVSFAEHNHYHSTPPKYYAIRKASDKLCEEYGLSVIRNPKGKGKSYIEHTATRQGTSWKAKLKTVIDLNISVAKDNSTGIIGVMRRKNNKYRSRIRVNGKLIDLGTYSNIEDAIVARLRGEKEYFGDFAPQKHLFEQYGI